MFLEKNNSASFRDPSGFVYEKDGVLYRCINRRYKEHYEKLIGSGLYDRLEKEGLLIPHEEVDVQFNDPTVYKIVKPRKIPVVSYPYEWSFSQLKDAALLTLKVQKMALDYGMTLKDASAFNVQFIGCSPVFIDTLSFEQYSDHSPWQAYRQFCQHFLFPLMLMHYTGHNAAFLFKEFIDGLPVEYVAPLLPLRSWFSLTPVLHVHLQAFMKRKYSSTKQTEHTQNMSKQDLYRITESMYDYIKGLEVAQSSFWADYYTDNNYSDTASNEKLNVVKQFAQCISKGIVWDIGSNDGKYSRAIASDDKYVITFDSDPAVVEANYKQCRQSAHSTILSLVNDFSNPSPSIGWANEERGLLVERAKPDLIVFLAVLHHIRISGNVPLALIAAYLASLGPFLIIEFISKEDSQVQRLLKNKSRAKPASRFLVLRLTLLTEKEIACRLARKVFW